MLKKRKRPDYHTEKNHDSILHRQYPALRKNHFPTRNEKGFWKDFQQRLKQPEGLGTLEIVIIIAVLLAVALIFREQITSFASELMSRVFDTSILDEIG